MVVLKLLVYLSILVSITQVQGISSDVVASEEIESSEDYPFLVSLINNGVHYCSGVCIDELWLLTVSHCIRPQWAKTTRLLFGTVVSNVSRTVRKIVQSHVHPVLPIKPQLTSSNASSETLNNIALIKFDVAIKTSDSVDKIIIEKKTGSLERRIGRCLGYGKMCENDTDSTHGQLVPYKIAKQDNYVYFRECDLKNAKIPCRCDSGGPFVLDNRLLGLTVCGENCGDKSKTLTNILLRVTPYLKWIESKVDSCGRRYIPTSSLISIVLYLTIVL